jgi:hypothetical protein
MRSSEATPASAGTIPPTGLPFVEPTSQAWQLPLPSVVPGPPPAPDVDAPLELELELSPEPAEPPAPTPPPPPAPPAPPVPIAHEAGHAMPTSVAASQASGPRTQASKFKGMKVLPPSTDFPTVKPSLASGPQANIALSVHTRHCA